MPDDRYGILTVLVPNAEGPRYVLVDTQTARLVSGPYADFREACTVQRLLRVGKCPEALTDLSSLYLMFVVDY